MKHKDKFFADFVAVNQEEEDKDEEDDEMEEAEEYEQGEDNQSDDEDEEEDENEESNSNVKRTKSAPPEMSSKNPVSRFRVVVPTHPQKFKPRDPRFHDVHNAGFNKQRFNDDYGFLVELRKKEVEDLRKQLKKTKNAERAAVLQKKLSTIQLQQKKFEEEQAEAKRKEQWKQQQVERIEKGHKPFFFKKSKQREVKMIEKYQELKKQGQLHNYMKKKAAKRAHKDQKLVPFQRRAQ